MARHTMVRPLKRLLVAIGLGAASLASAVSAFAQYPYPYYPYNYNSYYYPYYNPYFSGDAYRGYLSGAADVIRSQGQFQVSSQQANLIKQQVEQAKIANRRRALDEWLYQRQVTPTREDLREEQQAQQLRHMQNDPEPTEVYSGLGLNVLLADTQKLSNLGIRGPEVPLEADTLRQINVTAGTGNVGLIKTGRLSWPFALAGPDFAGDRAQLDGLTQAAVKQARAGQVDAATIEAIQTALQTLRTKLKARITQVPVMQFIHATTFLDNYKSAVRALQQPGVADYFNGTYAARGQTVADLVRYMTSQGLQFAPAVAGQEAAYMALYQALARFDVGAHALAGDQLLARPAGPPR